MTRVKWVAVVAVFFGFGLGLGLSVGSSVAHAEAPKTVNCDAPVVYARKAGWMNEQLAAGRTQFVSVGDAGMCAW